MKTKRCARCKEYKALDDFHRNKRKPDGRAQYCKPCAKKAAHEYYARNAEAVKARVAQYRADHLEEERERSRQYAKEHAEEAKERARKWALEHPDRVRETRRRYRRERPDVWRRNNALRRARKRGAEVLGRVDFEDVLARDGHQCWICGKRVKPEDLSFDHAVPLSKGGEHSVRNLRVAHQFCNYSKHDKLVPHQMLLF